MKIVSKKPNYKKLVTKKIRFLCSECNIITLKSNLFYTIHAEKYGLNDLLCGTCFISNFKKYSQNEHIYQVSKLLIQKEEIEILHIPGSMLQKICSFSVKNAGQGKYYHLFSDSDVELVHDFIYGLDDSIAYKRKKDALIRIEQNNKHDTIELLKKRFSQVKRTKCENYLFSNKRPITFVEKYFSIFF